MTGLNRIWRIAPNGADGTITGSGNEILEFDEVPIPSGGQFFVSTRAEVSVDITETNALKGNINPSQDGGVGSVRLHITGIIKGVPAVAGRKMLLKWLYQDKTTENFEHGRFGTVLESLPEFDLTPVGGSSGYGWLIENIELIKDGEWKNKTSFIMILKYNGSIGTEATPLGLGANVD